MALTRRDITSRQIWDGCIEQYAPLALFQSWMWGEVNNALKRKVWRWGWFEGSKLVAVAQIEMVPARRGPFLHVRHGPVLIKRNASYWKHILADLQQLAKREHAWFIRISPQVSASKENKQFFRALGLVAAPIHAMDAEYCWVLDIDKDEDELLSSMRKTTRYEIKRAQKLGVNVRMSTDPRQLRHFSGLYAETAKRHDFVRHVGITEEFRVFAPEGNAALFLATHEGRLLASAIVLFWGSQAIYHHGASLTSKIPASYLVQWSAIREAKNRGKKLYNFWGIAPEDNINHPWRGITLFKKGFGGREIKFIHAQDYPISRFYLIPKLVEGVRKRFKGY